MRFSRFFSVFFLSVIVGSLLALFPADRADALAVYVRFLNRYNAMLTGLEVTQADRDSGDLNDDLDGLTIAQINQVIDAQLTDAQMVDSNMTDGTMEYVNSDDNCETKLSYDNDGSEWEMTRIGIIVSGRGCVELTPGKDWVLGGPLGSTNIDVTNVTMWFRWDNANTMSRVDGKEGAFVEDPLQPGNYFRIEETGEGDQDFVTLNEGSFDGGVYYPDDDNIPTKIGALENREEPPTDYEDATNNAGSLTPQEDKSCENISGFDLGWILCPIIRMADSTMNWLDTRIQGLLAIEENKYQDNERLFVAWTQIRNIAYIILIPIMLVMVIGTALGLEAFSAYTVKKALPRMVAAVIFITFSWYITSFMITFINVVGGGLQGLMSAPFSLGGIPASDVRLSNLFGPNNDLLSAFLVNLTIAAAVVVMLWLFLGTMLLVIATAFVILLLRQMFIIALILVAPLAILAWIFPGNDKFWKMWWDAFTKLLLMFPIIMAVIAVGRIFAVIILTTDNGGFDGVSDELFVPLMALVAYVIPYGFIPFTFKLAGGLFGTLTGMVNDKEKGLFDKARENRAHKTERAGRKVLQKRANTAARLNDRASRSGAVGGFLARQGARKIGGYNIEAAMSAKNAQVGKEIQDQIATGRDDSIRGLAAYHNYEKFQQMRKQMGDQAAAAEARRLGIMDDSDGTRKFKSLGGAMIGEASVLEGQKRWGGDHFAQQAALSYEMRKAMTPDQVQGISNDYSSFAKSMGMTESEATGAWVGAGFENQNQHLEFKNTGWGRGQINDGQTAGALNAKKFVEEAYQKKGTYPLSQMSSHTVDQLANAYETGDEDVRRKVTEIAQTFVSSGGGQVEGIAGEGDAAVPIRGGGGYGPPTARSQGSAAVDASVKRLADLTGAVPPPRAPQPPQPQQPGPPPQGTFRDDDGNIRQGGGGPGGGGVILGG